MSAELELRRLATTILLEQPTEIPTNELPFARSFIAVCRFTYAKSVPESPHEYSHRNWSADQAAFDRFAALIREHGYKGRFLSTVYTYVDLEGHRYWTSPSYFPPGSVMLNRASNTLAPARRPGEAAATVAGDTPATPADRPTLFDAQEGNDR
jgi:hypothetical protein